MRPISRWLRRDDGQDLAEYCLLTALVALVAAAIFLQVSGGMKNLWNFAGQTTNSAATAASPSQPSSGGGATKGGQ
jgi:Flp pilus assembly pilin Flp